MASYYVISAVQYGSRIVQAGSLVTDTADDVSGLLSAGAVLWPAQVDDPVALAAATCQALRARGQSRDFDAIMQVAATRAQMGWGS
jgi:hypothetical protein